jgi:hypothetical protein
MVQFHCKLSRHNIATFLSNKYVHVLSNQANLIKLLILMTRFLLNYSNYLCFECTSSLRPIYHPTRHLIIPVNVPTKHFQTTLMLVDGPLPILKRRKIIRSHLECALFCRVEYLPPCGIHTLINSPIETFIQPCMDASIAR